jgi:hypothetical protein
MVLMMTRKLKHYFPMHSIWVVYDCPLVHVLQSKEVIGRIAQWIVEIGQYDVEYIPRWVIKSQVVTDFTTEWTDSDQRGIDESLNHWVMYFDGSYTLKGTGASVMLIPPPPKGEILKYAIQLEFPATNNIAE